jgi:uncharacterized protein YegP (UPF0339 family)/LysM repeat protein
MSLSNLVTTFKDQAAANDGNITIDAATFTASGLTPPEGLDELITQSYQLSDGTNLLIDTGVNIPAPVGNTLTIKGAKTAVFNLDKSNTSVELVIVANASNEVQFTIEIDLSDWKFATTWKYMTGGVFDHLPYTSPSFVFSTEEKTAYSWQSESIALVKGQNFASFITLTNWLESVVDFLVSWPKGTKVALVGSIDPSQVNDQDIIYPDMNLYVKLNAELISLGFLKVSNPGVGFQIETSEQEVEPVSGEERALLLAQPGMSAALLTEGEKEKVQTPVLYFMMELDAGDHIQLDFSAAVDSSAKAFMLNVTSDPAKPLTPLNLFSLMAGNNWFENIPPVLQQYLNAIAFKGFSTSLDFSNGLSINSVSATVGSNGAWVLFDDLTIEEFDVNWLIIDPGPGKTNAQSLYFTAHVNFFPTIFQGGFEVEITSDLTLSASFEGMVSINDLLSAITGGFIKIPSSLASVDLTGFGIAMDINQKYYSFYATGDVAFNLITNISLTDATLQLSSTTPTNDTGKTIYNAAISGLFAIGELQLQSDVKYNSAAEDGGWELAIAMPEGNKLNLGQLVEGLFKEVGFELPESFLPADLSIISFDLSADIPNGDKKGNYEVKTALQWNFVFPIIEQDISITAALMLAYDGTTQKYSGGVMGSILLKDFNAQVNIGYNFTPDSQLLMIEWEGFIAQYDVQAQSRTITFEIKNWSVGSLITSFMKMLFDPTFELDAPWDVLNKISLDGFKVTYNLDTTEVTVDYKLPKSINLVFITIDGIKLTKNSKGVQISFDGSSVVPSINDSKVFKKDEGQDVKNMPEVPGQGSQYFDLRLLALGQHVTLQNIAQYQTIKAVTDAMGKAFVEPKPGELPVGGSGLLQFDENSNWLIATDFGILNVGTKEKPAWTLEMQIVFNDPNLYGLRIAMAGQKAKIFAGLEFEIMYKKISDAVGVYQIELTLPDAIRNLQFGAVNITLPSIGVQIYTNGDFMVNIGFPYNLDFSKSFTVQAIVPPGIPAMGSGGFYFGKLSSATTNKVPQTNYGNFNPVIVFGIGLQVGVGYSINYGVLKAGFSITIFGIIEGVIATYHPYEGNLPQKNSTEVETSYYYWLQGTLGLIGKLYGTIDFAIISASVNITIKIYAQATLEAYNKMPLAIVASVDVKVSAKLNLGIFSITIHFSFSARISLDLTVGTDRTKDAPWNRPLTGAAAASLDMFVLPSQRRLTEAAPLRAMHYNTQLVAAADEALPVLNIYFVPHLTIAGAENGNLKDQAAQYVTTLWIDAPNPANDDQENISSFEYLSKDFFRWLIQNYANPSAQTATRAEADTHAVSQKELDALLDFLSNDQSPIPIPTAKLLEFLQTTFSAVNIQNVSAEAKPDTAAVFPMFFDLELSVPDAGVSVDFSTYNLATDEYLSEVKEWFAQLAVKVSEEDNDGLNAKAAAEAVQHSLSTFVFEDYFVLIGKQLIGYAGDALENYTYPLTNGNSLAQMLSWANSIQTADGTVNEVSAPGLAKANQSHPLNKGLSVNVTGLMYTLDSGDSFNSVGAVYALYTPLLITQNAAVPGLLVAGQEVKLDGNTYTVRQNDTISQVASGLQSTVSQLAANKDFQYTAQLTTGAMLVIAAAEHTAQSEETFNSLAAAYTGVATSALLLQNQVVSGLFIAGNSFEYNAEKYTIQPGDTLASMAASLSASGTETVTVDDLANDAAVQALSVQPLGVALIPPFVHTTQDFTSADEADTLGGIAQKYSTTAAVLGSNYANQQLGNIFYSEGDYASANIPGLQCLDVSSILDYFSTNQSYTGLSGMVSRYQLHGMRLPTSLPGLTLGPGSPCTADGTCALFRLTGQQFAIPADVKAGFTISLVNNTLDWLQFNGQVPSGDPKEATLSVVLDEDDIKQITTVLEYATGTGIQPQIYSLAPIRPYELMPVQYSFKTVTKWSTSGQLKLPNGSLGNQATPAPLIWNFPSSLLRQISLPKREGSAFDIQIGTYDATAGEMKYRESSYFGWSTLLEIDIKKQSEDQSAGTSSFTYELIGADEAGTQLLERLLRALDPQSGNNNQGLITDVQWLYSNDDGLASVGNANMKTYIVQSNLSTETNPDQRALQLLALPEETEPANGVLNSLYDFIKLLWQCSITRSGGYYLLYNETENGAGFPDAIFDSSDNATIQLLVTYTNSYRVEHYMNAALTGEQIDTSSSVVYAESKARESITYTTPDDQQTLASITAQYNILLSELAELNKISVQLVAGTPITLQGLVYEVGLPGGKPGNTLASIAEYYNVKPEDIQALNPGVSSWDDLPVWQLLQIPEVSYEISTAAGTAGNTMQSIAQYYFVDIATLAFQIRNSKLFAASTTFSIVDQVVHKVASIAQGSAGFELLRKDPGTPPDKPADPGYAEAYLKNLYNLLNYQVVGNRYFTESIVGLPAGPTTNADEQWNYKQVIDIAQYAVDNPKMSYQEGYPQKKDNPYRGIGHTLQIHFDWVDYYGNNTVTPFSDPKLDPGAPLNNAPVQVGYMDELKGFSQWPSNFITYNFNRETGSNPVLSLDFTFNTTKYQSTEEASQTDNYLASIDYMGHPRSEAYPDFSLFEQAGEYYFAMLDSNGAVVLRSEGYKSAASRENGIESVIRHREHDQHFSTEKIGDRYYLVLKAANHQEIARSFPHNEDGTLYASLNGNEELPEWKRNALHDLYIYTNIYYQINQLAPDTGKNTLSITLRTSLMPDVATALDAAQLDKINGYVKDIYSYLSAIVNDQNLPAVPSMDPIEQAVDITQLNTQSIFELAVTLEMERDLSFVNNDFRDSDFVKRAVSRIQPDTTVPAGGDTPRLNAAGDEVQQHSLSLFALNFEKAFYAAGDYLLKVATGVEDATAGGEQNQAVFVVRMGLKPDVGIYWDVQPSGTYELTAPSIAALQAAGVPATVTDKLTALEGTVYANQADFDTALKGVLTESEFEQYQVKIYTYSLLNAAYFAPRPTSTSLKSKKGVELCRYQTGQGLDCSSNDTKNFTDIDMDIWGKQCLEAIDLFLGSEIAVPAFLVDQLKAAEEKGFLEEQGIDAQSFLEAVTHSKSELANTLSSTVVPILTAPDVDQQSLLGAQEKFRQQLLMKLGSNYTINAVVQMKVTAQSGISQKGEKQIAPRLYGSPGITGETEEQKKLYSISNAKIQLNFDEAQNDAQSELSFIFSTKDAKEFTSVPLKMNYQITHIEYDITDVPEVEGYQASQWLTFIIPANMAEQDEPEMDQSPLKQSLGNLDIPVVLRNYPTPPTLTKQEGLAAEVSGDTTKVRLEKASEWNFLYSYTEDQAAQDQIYSDITFNAIPQQSSSPKAFMINTRAIRSLSATKDALGVAEKLKALKGQAFTGEAAFEAALSSVLTPDELASHRTTIYAQSEIKKDLFAAMAQFITVWPQVQSDLDQYLGTIAPSTEASDPAVSNAFYAMQAMVQIANDLALAWKAFVSATSNSAALFAQSDASSSYDFVIQQKEDPDFTTQCTCQESETCQRLLLVIVPPENMTEQDKAFMKAFAVEGEADLPHTPVVNIPGYTRVPATDKEGKEIPNSYWYAETKDGKVEHYLGYPCSFEIPGRTVEVDGLNVMQFQHAWAGISVIRNEGLVPDNPTNKDFIYQTPLVRYSNQLIPLLNNKQVFDIAKIESESGVKRTLAEHLANFFSTFFTYDQLAAQTIKISASWNYFLEYRTASTLPAIQLPILLFPPFPFDIPGDYQLPQGGCPAVISSDTPFVCQMAEALKTWYVQKSPVVTDAYFQFDLSVFSALSETQLPLIQLSNLILPYGNITDLVE